MQSKKLHDAASMLEAMQGVGTILGPIIGSSIYTAVGFKLTFYYLGGALIPLAFIINCIVASAITRTETEEERTEPLLSSQVVATEANIDFPVEEESIGNWDLIKDARLSFACMCAALSYFCDTQLEPIFAPRLEEFGLTTMQIGYMFTIIPLTFIPSMMIVQYFPSWIARRFTLILSCIFLGVATYFNGPSQLFNMPNQLTYIVIGQAFSGIFVAFLIIPVLPEMMTAANVKFEGR